MQEIPFDYPYLESEVNQGLVGQSPRYLVSPDLAQWIKKELSERVTKVGAQEGRESVQVYCTRRSFRKCPVFLLGYPQEDEKKMVLEAWYFRIMGTPEGVSLTLDRVPLKRLFKDLQNP